MFIRLLRGVAALVVLAVLLVGAPLVLLAWMGPTLVIRTPNCCSAIRSSESAWFAFDSTKEAEW